MLLGGATFLTLSWMCESIIVLNVRSSVDIVSRCPEYYCNVYTQLLSSSLQSIIASLLQVSGRVGHCLLSQLLSLTRPKLRSTQHTLQVRVVLQRTERIIETFIGFKPPGHILRNSPWTPSGISNHNSSLMLTFYHQKEDEVTEGRDGPAVRRHQQGG